MVNFENMIKKYKPLIKLFLYLFILSFLFQMIDRDIVFFKKSEDYQVYSKDTTEKHIKEIQISMSADLGEMIVGPEYRSKTDNYLDNINSIYKKNTSKLSYKRMLLVNYVLRRYGNSNAGNLLSMYRELKPDIRHNLKNIANKFLTDRQELVQILADNSSQSLNEIYSSHTTSDIGLITENSAEEIELLTETENMARSNNFMFP